MCRRWQLSTIFLSVILHSCFIGIMTTGLLLVHVVVSGEGLIFIRWCNRTGIVKGRWRSEFFSIFYYKIKENILIQIMQDSLSLCHRPPFVSLFLANSEKQMQLRCHVGFCDEVAWNKGSKRNGGIIASLCFISLLNYVLFFRLIVWWMSPSGTHHFLFLIRTNTSFDLKVKGKLYPILYFHICLWIKLIFLLTSSKKLHLF